jgi:hypothetical protein
VKPGAARADYRPEGHGGVPTGDRPPRPDRPLRHRFLDREQMTELAVRAVTALQTAGFDAEVDRLCGRVFSQPPERLFETGPGGTIQYRPVVELLLLHVRGLAESRARPAAERRAEIAWAFDVAGF